MLSCFNPIQIRNRRFSYKNQEGRWSNIPLPDDAQYRITYQYNVDEFNRYYSNLPLPVRQFNPVSLEPIRYMFVPCGKCPACLARKALWLRQRLTDTFNNSVLPYYITLTYQNDFLPEDKQLNKKHVQDFHKRLRSSIDEVVRSYYKLPRKSKIPKELKVSYKHFSVGEYGERNHRPHYHCLIFFNTYLPSFDHTENKRERDIWTNRWKERNDYDRLFQSCWNFGTVDTSIVRHDNHAINYVSKYVTKPDEKHSNSKKYKPMRALRSNGIGIEYLSTMLSYHAADPLNRVYHIDGLGRKTSLSPYIKGKLRDKGLYYPTSYDAIDYNIQYYEYTYDKLEKELLEYSLNPLHYEDNKLNSRSAFTDRQNKFRERYRCYGNKLVESHIEEGY